MKGRVQGHGLFYFPTINQIDFVIWLASEGLIGDFDPAMIALGIVQVLEHIIGGIGTA